MMVSKEKKDTSFNANMAVHASRVNYIEREHGRSRFKR